MKCAAVNCRSGLRPTKKEKESLCEKRHVFAFPKNEKIRALWVKAVRRQDARFNPNNSGVCELHFSSDDFVIGIAPRTKTERKRERLKYDAVPSNFPNYPETARPKIVKTRPTSLASTSARLLQEKQVLQEKSNVFFNADKLADLQDLFKKLSQEMLPSGFRYSKIFAHNKSHDVCIIYNII